MKKLPAVKKLLLMPLCCLLLSGNSQAQIPVTDWTHIAETAVDLLNQVDQFREVAKTVQKLRVISSAIRSYGKIREVVDRSADIVELYGQSVSSVQADRHFSPREISAITQCYKRLLKESASMVEDLLSVTKSDFLSMSDGERLLVIDRLHARLTEHHALVKYFTSKIAALSASRAQGNRDLQVTLALYGIGSETPDQAPF